MNLRLVDDELETLHPTLCVWWQDHGWPPIPLVALRTMALLAEDGGKPLAAGFVYTASTGSFAMLEWVVTNPAAAPLLAFRAVNALVEFAVAECQRRGYAALFTTCRQAALGRVYEKNGFIKTDEGVTHYLRPLV